jgi:hypothetical protein
MNQLLANRDAQNRAKLARMIAFYREGARGSLRRRASQSRTWGRRVTASQSSAINRVALAGSVGGVLGSRQNTTPSPLGGCWCQSRLAGKPAMRYFCCWRTAF